ncbi:MAG: hypothetical protein FJZ96_05590 [Chloroflexi bacterium]|nr:hypothetical protein [Chloroflexota bacterium]
MASWIVHLRIAENLLERIPALVPASFAVGSIAPDCGVPDEKWENFNPPPEVTHFGNFPGAERKLADLEFYRRYLLPLRAAQEPGPFSFRLGYFFHLVTDNLWSAEIAVPTTKRFPAEFGADKEFIWEVKKDWYGLDFVYVRDHPGCLFWRIFLGARAGTGGLDFLPLEAVRQRVEYIRQYYQRTDEKVQAAYHRPYIYLTQAAMDAFVADTSLRLERIWDRLQRHPAPAAPYASALDFPLEE